jgi:hypothetical protein
MPDTYDYSCPLCGYWLQTNNQAAYICRGASEGRRHSDCLMSLRSIQSHPIVGHSHHMPEWKVAKIPPPTERFDWPRLEVTSGYRKAPHSVNGKGLALAFTLCLLFWLALVLAVVAWV